MKTPKITITPNAAFMASVQAEAAIHRAQLGPNGLEVARLFHLLALGRHAVNDADIGPLYLRQALNLRLGGYRLVENAK